MATPEPFLGRALAIVWGLTTAAWPLTFTVRRLGSDRADVSLDVALRTGDEIAIRGRTWRVLRTLLFFSVFHSVATMLLPAVLIHARRAVSIRRPPRPIPPLPRCRCVAAY